MDAFDERIGRNDQSVSDRGVEERGVVADAENDSRVFTGAFQGGAPKETPDQFELTERHDNPLPAKPSAPTARVDLGTAQARGQLVEDAVDVLVAIGGTEDLGHLDAFVDHDLVGDIDAPAKLVNTDAQNRQLDRIDILDRAIKHRAKVFIQLGQIARHAGQQFMKIRAVDLAEVVVGSKLRFDIGHRLVSDLPGIQRLHSHAARLAPGRCLGSTCCAGLLLAICHLGPQLLDHADHFDC